MGGNCCLIRNSHSTLEKNCSRLANSSCYTLLSSFHVWAERKLVILQETEADV